MVNIIAQQSMVIIAKNQSSFSKAFLLLARPLIYHSADMAGRRDKSSVIFCWPEKDIMHEFLISTAIVALAEMGDKTQLLALLLAARFRKPVPILIAILLATLINHGLSAALGQFITTLLSPEVMMWILSLGFIAMAVWMLIPDQLDDETDSINRWQKLGVFGATFILFFLAEIGDKTQIATVALAARFDSLWWVMAGTTVGMMLANAPAVFIGNKMADRLPVSLIHKVGAAIFLIIGISTLVQHYLF
jgi:putative Ca2+/H+ antiporter (TMEM165/GDT1 family)